MYTMKDVAKKASVSIGTVSNYINKTKPVQPKTAHKIQKAIDELHFSPNHAARILKTKCVNEMGVILPHIQDPYYAAILRGIEKELRTHHYDMNLIFSDEIPEIETKALQNFSRKNVAGVLLITCQPSQTETFLQYLGHDQLPSVFIDRKPGWYDANLIHFDNYKTIQYLMDAVLGENPRAQIGLMVGNCNHSCERECVQSYMDTLEKYHLDAPSHYICYTNATKEDAFKEGIHLLRKSPLDYVLTSSEQIALGLNEANDLLNHDAIHGTQIISFGEDNWLNESSNGQIIKTNRMAHLMGQEAVALLLRNIESPTLFEKQQVKLQDKIVDKNRRFVKTSPLFFEQKSGSLKIAMLDAPITQAMQHILSHFTDHTGISVELTRIPQEKLLQQIMMDAQSTEGQYDVYMYDLPWLSQLASLHCLMDLSCYIQNEPFDASAYIPHLLEHLGLYQAKYYGVPYLFSSQILLYRSDLFQDSDLRKDYERTYKKALLPPKSWLEFNAISEFFTEALNPKSPVPYGTSIAGKTQEILVAEFLCRLWAYNGRLFNEQNKLLIDTPEFKKAMRTFVETHAFCNPITLNHTIEDTVDDFLHGDTALLVTYSSYLHDLSNPNVSKVVGKYRFQPLPGHQPLIGGWALGLSPHCKQPDAAFSFIHWACGPHISHYFTLLEGQSPIKEIYSNDEMIHLYPWLPLIYEAHNKTNLRRSPQHPRKKVIPMDEIEAVLFTHLRAALLSQCTPDEAVAGIHLELSLLFRRYGY